MKDGNEAIVSQLRGPFELHIINSLHLLNPAPPPKKRKNNKIYEFMNMEPRFFGGEEILNLEIKRGRFNIFQREILMNQSFRAQLRLISLFLLSLYLSIGAE